MSQLAADDVDRSGGIYFGDRLIFGVFIKSAQAQYGGADQS